MRFQKAGYGVNDVNLRRCVTINGLFENRTKTHHDLKVL
jgi:hypothetical protein